MTVHAHSSLAVANRFIELAREQQDALTPLQLIKLTYLAHGFMLGLHSRPLVAENAEAWTYGPVFPELYRAVRRFRSNPVPELPGDGADTPGAQGFAPEEEDVIRQVYEIYGRRSGIALSRLTHTPGSPWSMVWDEGPGHSVTISNDLLEEYFSRASGAPAGANLQADLHR